MLAALLACAIGIATFARGAYQHSSRVNALEQTVAPAARAH